MIRHRDHEIRPRKDAVIITSVNWERCNRLRNKGRIQVARIELRREYKYKYLSQEEEETTRGEMMNETYRVLAEVRVRRPYVEFTSTRFRFR